MISKNHEAKVFDSMMNDKCAAGTGRFLEVMAGVLDVDINDMGALGAAIIAGRQIVYRDYNDNNMDRHGK